MAPKRVLLFAATSSFALFLTGCGGGGTTSEAPPPAPVPAPTPDPAPSPAPAPEECAPPAAPAPAPNDANRTVELYCPDNSSFYGIEVGPGGTTSWNNSGWTTRAYGNVQGKTSFNLLGGYVEFDVDNSGTPTGVNSNFYTISPDHAISPDNKYPCDGQGEDGSTHAPACMELDFYQSSRPSDVRTVWHTRYGRDGGCDSSGCTAHTDVHGQFHVKAEFDSSGWMHTYINGNEVTSFDRCPGEAARNVIRDTMTQRGVAFRSTQWIETGKPDIIDTSQFSISNIRVSGSVVFGPEPPKCGQSETLEISV